MKTSSSIVLTVFLVCALIGFKPNVTWGSLYQPPPAHHKGPRQMIGARWGWAINDGAQGTVVVQTTNGGKSWQDRTPPGFSRSAPDLNDGDNWAASFGLSTLGSKRCWIAFGSHIKNQSVIVIERTADGGQHWRHQAIAGGADTVILQFLDAKHGFLLALGSPAAGLMDKEFYSTNEGGKKWTKGGSPDYASGSHTPIGNYYPDGMAFCNTREGWITGTNHSDLAMPLIQTHDGGRIWAVQPILLPPPYENGGTDTYQPRFYGKGHKLGAFTAQFIDSAIDTNRDVNYVTHDGGKHWRMIGTIRRNTH